MDAVPLGEAMVHRNWRYCPIGTIPAHPLGKVAMLLQICQYPLDRVAGEIEGFGYGLDAGPTASNAAGAVVHIDREYAVRQK